MKGQQYCKIKIKFIFRLTKEILLFWSQIQRLVLLLVLQQTAACVRIDYLISVSDLQFDNDFEHNSFDIHTTCWFAVVLQREVNFERQVIFHCLRLESKSWREV